MLKLTSLSNMALAVELQERLARVGVQVEASFSAAVEAIHLGGLSVDVWMLDEADQDLARQVANEFLEEAAARTHGKVCRECRYNLTGHINAGRCPECGHEFRLGAHDVRCPQCNEEVPANFETCWNCGRTMAASP